MLITSDRVPSSGSTLLVETDAREVSLNGRPITLTRVEFDILQELWNAPNRVLTHGYLLSVISGSSWTGPSHGLEVHICRLRRKLGESGSTPGLIRTVRGVGYKYVPREPVTARPRAEVVRTAVSPEEFEELWQTAMAHPAAHYMQRGRDLIVTALEMPGPTFLDWDPADLEHRFISFNPQPEVFLNQHVAVRLVMTLASCGLTHSNAFELVRTPQGVMWAKTLRHIQLAANGDLLGVESLFIPTDSPTTPSIN